MYLFEHTSSMNGLNLALMLDSDMDSYIKNGIYYKGNKLVTVRDDVMHYCEVYNIDVIQMCEYAVNNSYKLYSIDNIIINDDLKVVLFVTLYLEDMFEPDVIKTNIERGEKE